MLSLCCKITIVNPDSETTYNLDFVDQVTVNSGWETMMDTAMLRLPKNVYVRVNNSPFRKSWAKRSLAKIDPNKLAEAPNDPLFALRNPVKIELGYNNKYDTVFCGVISKIQEKAPFQLECNDVLWLLKDVLIKEKKFEVSTSLDGVLKYLNGELGNNKDIQNLLKLVNETSKNTITETISSIISPGSVTPELPEAEIGSLLKSSLTGSLSLSNFTIVNKSVYEVLMEIKENYEIEVFAVNGTVYVGDTYPKNLDQYRAERKFGFQYNIISDDLISMEKDQIYVSVVAHGIPTIGDADSVETAEVGDATKDATKIHLRVFNVKNPALTEVAQRKLDKLKYDGLRGNVVAFGTPFVRHGDKLKIKDFYMSSKGNTYRIKSVEYSFGQGGYRQKIELHNQV